VRRQNPHGSLPLEAARLADRALERAEAVTPVDEHDRQLCGVLEAERPVEGGVAAADDHAALVPELRLLAHDVVQALAFPAVPVVDAELPRLEGAVAGGDDQRAGEVLAALVGREPQDVPVALERLRLFAETDVGAVLQSLLGAEVDELLAQDLRLPRDV